MNWVQLCLMTATYMLGTNALKRGLVAVTTATSATDDTLLTQPKELGWYYTYGVTPPTSYNYGGLPFVPQQWGSYGLSSFQSNVLSLKLKEKVVLASNEPDGTGDGQSNISSQLAATAWMANIEPLKAQGFRLGSPAVTRAPSGQVWMKEFLGNCSACSIDFLALHWYGNYDGPVSHMEGYRTALNKTMWVTEFALPDSDVTSTQRMMNQTMSYLDNNPSVERYSWFGGFRSTQSNVGPNAAFLDANRKLTQLGQSYLALSSSTTAQTSTSSSSVTTTVWPSLT